MSSTPGRFVRVKGLLQDLKAFSSIAALARHHIEQASLQPMVTDRTNELARRLHPEVQQLVITEMREETPTTRTYRLEPRRGSTTTELAYFRAGQYLSIRLEVDGHEVTRPYSISSAPSDAPDGFYELTVKKPPDGFVAAHIFDTWVVGTEILASGPRGSFHHDPLRDGADIVGIAGGSGVTPFRSLAKEIVRGHCDARLTLLYGSVRADEIIFRDELDELVAAASDRFRVVYVLSDQEGELPTGFERGFVTAELIDKYADVHEASFFFCGPGAMHTLVMEALTNLEVPRRRIRAEAYGPSPEVVAAALGTDETTTDSHEITVRTGPSTVTISGESSESILVALERAGFAPRSECRAGECGCCRARIVKGDVLVLPDNDRRRAADVSGGFVHLCATYPTSDVEIEIM